MDRRLASLLAASVMGACHGASHTSPDATIPAAPPDADGVSGFDVHISDASHKTGIAGATVCVAGQSDCETTDAHGDAKVSVAGPPSDLSLGFIARAAGHLTTVELGRVYGQLDVSVYTVPSDIALVTDAQASDLFTAAGFASPPSTGYVRVTVLDGVTTAAELGATVTLDGGGSAVYLDAAGRPDHALTAIGPGGGVLFGDVPAGPFSLTVHVANKACIVQSFAWDGRGSSSATGVVVAGALTDGITLACYATR
jgi:hypothetical protein